MELEADFEIMPDRGLGTESPSRLRDIYLSASWGYVRVEGVVNADPTRV